MSTDENGKPLTYWGGLAEPKQELEKELFELEQELDIPSSMRWHNSKPNQETLEEAANRLATMIHSRSTDAWYLYKDGIIKGIEYQAKRMYSEEEVLNILFQWSMYGVDIEFDKLVDKLPSILPYDEWFEQFKKK